MSDDRSAIDLETAYRECRRITARHGRSYYLAGRLLPAQHRRAVHALYAFARTVDDVVDHPTDPAGVPARLNTIEDHLGLALSRRADPNGPSGQTIWPNGPLGLPLAALADTVGRFEIGHEYFAAFLRSMRMDVPGCAEYRESYRSMAELCEYMYGSATVIGLQLLPVLGTVGPRVEAEPAAAALGEAFQLTNFLRDIGEDLDRGRIYLPTDDLAAFGVDSELLAYCRAGGSVDRRVRRAMAHFIALTRGLYRDAEPGIGLLSPRARPGIAAAWNLYSAILDRIEDTGYAVFDRRAVVPRHRRAFEVVSAFVKWGPLGRGATPREREAHAAPLRAFPEGSRLR